jgi:conjugative transfer signal peptidase TraF
MMRRRGLVLVVGTLAGVGLLSVGRCNTSESLPRGVYLALPRGWLGRSPGRGDLVLACAPAAAGELARRRGYLGRGPCAAGAAGSAAALGKVVLAVAGDEVAFGEVGLAVNGRAVVASRPEGRDTAGRALAHFPFGRFRMLPGEVWLFSPFHRRSYDSRYFGPVPVAAVRGWLIPALVVNDDRFAGFRLHRFHLSVLPEAASQ